MEESKHILFLVSSMEGGGSERVTALLCNYWISNGYQVTLMPTYSGKGDLAYPVDTRVNVKYLADLLGSKKNNLWNRLKRFLLLRKYIIKNKPDLIISFLTQVNVISILSSIGTGIPIIVSERTYPPKYQIGFLWTKLRKITYPIATAVVMQTHQGLEWINKECPKAKNHVIPNPILYPVPTGKPIIEPESIVKKERKICLAVGRLDKDKRFSEIINAFSCLAEQFHNWDLIILGNGEERLNLEKQIKLKGLVNRVYLPGRAGNIDRWYQRANLFVMYSRYEGFPNALLEAMAYGIPCISADCDTGPREIIVSEENGILLAKNETIDNLKKSMMICMRNKNLADKFGKSATKVRDKFSINSVGLQWNDLINKFLTNPKNP